MTQLYIVIGFDLDLAEYCPTPIPGPDPKFLSPCPEGYDTILGYLAKHFPAQCSDMERPAAETVKDGKWLTAKARQYPARVIIVVPAPWVLEDIGVREVNAYPVDMLRDHLGE